MSIEHHPVMLEETAEALALEGAETVVDATFGGGGHTGRILRELGSEGRVIGIDRDPEVAARAAGLAEEDRRFTFRPGAYDGVLEGLVVEGVKVDAVLFDLGLSSYQINEAERGFSYVREGPLDMRMDPERGESAADFLNGAEAVEIADVLVRYGDVPRGEARRVVREIVRRRPLATTVDLSEAVRTAVGWKERGGNPAKRIFQAVRVYINDEVGGLERALSAAERLLLPGGRLVAITFHSGEDRVVKRFSPSVPGVASVRLSSQFVSAGHAPSFAGASSGGLRRERWRKIRAAHRRACAPPCAPRSRSMWISSRRASPSGRATKEVAKPNVRGGSRSRTGLPRRCP